MDEPQPERPAPAPLALPAFEVPGAKKDDELLSDWVDGTDCDGRWCRSEGLEEKCSGEGAG